MPRDYMRIGTCGQSGLDHDDQRGIGPPFSRVFVAKSRRRRQSYGAFSDAFLASVAPGA